jgi:hypothetical protein
VAGQLYSHRRKFSLRQARADRSRRTLSQRIDSYYIRSPYNGIQPHKEFRSGKSASPRP